MGHRRNSIKFLLYFLGFFFLSIPLWVDRYFGTATFDQLLLTLKFGIKGAVTSDPIFIKRFVLWCIVVPLTLSSVFLFMNHRLKRCFHLVILCIGFAYFCIQFNVVSFFLKNRHANNGIDFYQENYINPAKMTFTSSHPKSLVLIYVEGFESTYANKNLFQKNLLHDLDKFRDDDGLAFHQFKQIYGTGWTVAGLVATQCAVPLKSITVFGDNRQGEVINQFLPGAKCLSDMLAEKGYQNIYMKGASLHFGGIGQFLKTHHYQERYGKEEWIALGEPIDTNGWGLHDDALFAQAKKRLAKLMKSDCLFNLTLLTVDTHGDKGYINPLCRQQGYRDFDGIIECTANQLSQFIAYIKKNGWLNKVSVVIIGDHLAMKNPVYDKLLSDNSRSIFNLLITTPKLSKRTDTISHFDWLATILDSLGYDFPGGRLGLGYSGLKHSKGLPFPSNRLSILESQIERYSAIYNNLWLPPSPIDNLS